MCILGLSNSINSKIFLRNWLTIKFKKIYQIEVSLILKKLNLFIFYIILSLSYSFPNTKSYYILSTFFLFIIYEIFLSLVGNISTMKYLNTQQ